MPERLRRKEPRLRRKGRNPDAFDLSADIKEAHALYDELKKLKAKHKKDRRFAALSEWKLAGLLPASWYARASSGPKPRLSPQDQRCILRDSSVARLAMVFIAN